MRISLSLVLQENCLLSAPQNHHTNKREKRSTHFREGLIFVFTFKEKLTEMWKKKNTAANTDLNHWKILDRIT